MDRTSMKKKDEGASQPWTAAMLVSEWQMILSRSWASVLVPSTRNDCPVCNGLQAAHLGISSTIVST